MQIVIPVGLCICRQGRKQFVRKEIENGHKNRFFDYGFITAQQCHFNPQKKSLPFIHSSKYRFDKGSCVSAAFALANQRRECYDTFTAYPIRIPSSYLYPTTLWRTDDIQSAVFCGFHEGREKRSCRTAVIFSRRTSPFPCFCSFSGICCCHNAESGRTVLCR